MNQETTKLWNNWIFSYPRGFKCFSNGKEYVLLNFDLAPVLNVVVSEDCIDIIKPMSTARYTINIRNKSLTVYPLDDDMVDDEI